MMIYLLAYFKPALHSNGDVLLGYLKSKGIVPAKPRQHLWYDAWNYTLSKGGKWNKKKKGKNF